MCQSSEGNHWYRHRSRMTTRRKPEITCLKWFALHHPLHKTFATILDDSLLFFARYRTLSPYCAWKRTRRNQFCGLLRQLCYFESLNPKFMLRTWGWRDERWVPCCSAHVESCCAINHCSRQVCRRDASRIECAPEHGLGFVVRVEQAEAIITSQWDFKLMNTIFCDSRTNRYLFTMNSIEINRVDMNWAFVYHIRTTLNVCSMNAPIFINAIEWYSLMILCRNSSPRIFALMNLICSIMGFQLNLGSAQ